MLGSFCNFAAQHIHTEPLTKPGEVKYPQLRLNPPNICQRRQISANFFRSAQSVHFLAPEHLNHSATPPKRPIFYTYMSLCCTCICAKVLFRSMFVARLYSQPRPPPPLRPCVPPPVCGSMSGSKSQESLDSFPTGPDQRPPSHCTTHFSHFERCNSGGTLTFLRITSPTTKLQGCSQTPCPTPPRLGTGRVRLTW